MLYKDSGKGEVAMRVIVASLESFYQQVVEEVSGCAVIGRDVANQTLDMPPLQVAIARVSEQARAAFECGYLASFGLEMGIFAQLCDSSAPIWIYTCVCAMYNGDNRGPRVALSDFIACPEDVVTQMRFSICQRRIGNNRFGFKTTTRSVPRLMTAGELFEDLVPRLTGGNLDTKIHAKQAVFRVVHN